MNTSIGSVTEVVADLVETDAICEGTVNDVAQNYADALRLKAVAQQAIDACTESLLDRLEDDQTNIAGLGSFARTTTNRKRNRYEDSAERMRSALIESVARHIAFDVATGEIEPMKRNVARAAVDLATQHASLSSLKQSARKALDLAPDDFYEYQRTATIKFTPGMES